MSRFLTDFQVISLSLKTALKRARIFAKKAWTVKSAGIFAKKAWNLKIVDGDWYNLYFQLIPFSAFYIFTSLQKLVFQGAKRALSAFTLLPPSLQTRADKGWAVKRGLRSSFNVWCGVGLARALFPRFRCAWRPAKFSFLQTGNPIFFL